MLHPASAKISSHLFRIGSAAVISALVDFASAFSRPRANTIESGRRSLSCLLRHAARRRRASACCSADSRRGFFRLGSGANKRARGRVGDLKNVLRVSASNSSMLIFVGEARFMRTVIVCGRESRNGLTRDQGFETTDVVEEKKRRQDNQERTSTKIVRVSYYGCRTAFS